MNDRRIKGVLPVDERGKKSELERMGLGGSKWFVILQGLALKTTSQSQTMSITDTI